MNKKINIKNICSKILKPLLYFSVFIGTLIITAGFGQLVQYTNSSKDVRTYFISKWMGDDPARQKIFNEYESCGNSTKEDLDKKDFKEIVNNPVTINQCAELTGSTEFVNVLKSADKINVTVAWPLSILDS